VTGPGIPSIHRRVLVWVMAALAMGASLLIASTYLTMKNELGEVFEDNLKQVALTVANHHSEYGVSRVPRIVDQLPKIYEQYGDFDFVTAVWARNGTLTHTSDSKVVLPFLSRSGLSLVNIGGEMWHLYTIVLEDGIVQAAQRDSARQLLARESSSKLVLPAVLMLAILALLLTLALKRGLAPLSLAADEVTARSVETLHPIALATQPAELHPLVGAINDLMARLGSALALQRHFLADAAHELRTPITALKLQLQLLERADDAPQREAARRELRAGIERAQHLIEQLLQLSRLAPETPALRREPVNLSHLVKSTVSAFSARADERQIDLGAVVEGKPVVVSADAQQLAILLNNLVDNALRHTPAGGRIDVDANMQEGQPCLSVSDSGRGIPESERPLVFDRFYRGASTQSAAPSAGRADSLQVNGSGLGLAIVRAVAERHEAAVSLDESPQGGLRVSVRFPENRVSA
jgi:signal transduction histidine kinase